VQAPVFHGYAMSVYAQLPANADSAAIRKALNGGIVHVTNPYEEAPTNQSVVEEQGIVVALAEDSTNAHDTRGFWLWMAADNIKLASREAVVCAVELAASQNAKLQ
jgi:aspartate-semialdehyde dehydrogenase